MKNWVTRKRIVLVVLLAVFLWLLWATAPLFHWLWFGWLGQHPTGTVLVLAAVALLVWAIQRSVTTRHGRRMLGCGFWLTGLVIISVLIGYIFLADGLTKWYLVKDIAVQPLETLPETTTVRYLPLEVAERYAKNKMQESVYQVGDIDPLEADGEVDWVAPRIPNGLWNSFLKRADGVMVVKPDGQVETTHQTMHFGEGMHITDNITWPLWRRHYGVDLSEFYYARVGNEVIAFAPYVGYRYVFPVQVPYWRGVFVVHGDGQIEDLTPAAAMADARFAGQRLYPEALARAIGEAWGYRHGVLNAWFTHEDQAQLPDASGSGNEMPYLLPTPAGPQWFLGLEPFGPTWSIFKIMFIDARSGVVQLKELPREAGLIGPSSALGYVRSAFPTYNWYKRGEKESSGDVIAIEPRPVIKNGVLYWQFSVTNTAYAGVRRTALVNAYSNEVIYFENLAEIQQFLAGSFSGHGAEAQTTPSSGSVDLSKLSDGELIRLLRQISDELERRNK
jgi:hypothetical protein